VAKWCPGVAQSCLSQSYHNNYIMTEIYN
jgi:hypothetical protein